MTTETVPTKATGNHSGHWGLGATLISALVIILFPIVTMSMFGAMVGANSNDYLESRDIDLGIVATYATTISLIVVAAIALLFALVGVMSALARRQPLGLSLSGLVLAAPALMLSIILLIIAVRCVEWAQGVQRDRFGSGRHQQQRLQRPQVAQ